VLAAVVATSSAYAQVPSVCYGTTSDGSLKNGWKLPASGSNISSYSTVGRLFGRTYVHNKVHDVVLHAYSALELVMPDTVFVYGETGLKEGGEFDPHKTHRNGLSVDFMVPVLNKDNASVPLPTSMNNKWGYDLEFDDSGKLEDLRIDYDAIAEHIYQLHVAAQECGIGIWRVIFDPELQPYLHETKCWPYLAENVEFSQTRSWVRHDEHYHVDFIVECEPAS
jgi:penicillin-insensitive murein endopeptidase